MGFRENVARFTKSFYNADLSRPDAEPRKGLFGFASALIQKKQQKPFVLNATTLDRLAKTDPVTWAILRAIKSRVNSTKWDIVPDTERIEKELDRWEEYAVEAQNIFGIQSESFTSKLLEKKLFDDVAAKLNDLLAQQTMNPVSKAKAIRWIFKMVKRKVVYEAEVHCEEVRKVFERPNTSAETSLRALQELVVHDLLVFDAGVIIKNYSRSGRLAEMYTVPGHQIKIYRNEDRTTPQPPEPAYVWEDNGIMRAEFTNAELLYIRQNPTQDGYGIAPMEVAAYVITASLYAEQYNIDYFKNSNVPPGVFSLGEKITEEQRSLFQSLWDNEVQGRAGGLHRMLFMAGSDNAKFIPLQNLSNRDMQMMEYMKWTVAIKCACYGLSPQDIGFTEDYKGLGGGGVADTQKGLSDSRGINTILHLLEEYYNAEIVKSEFDYMDVKFQWQKEDSQDGKDEAGVDLGDIQQGVLSRNERRAKRGLKPIPGGDVVTVQTGAGLVPVESLEAQEEQPLQEELAPGQGQPGEVTEEAPKLDENGQPLPTEELPEEATKEQPNMTLQDGQPFQRRAPVEKKVLKIAVNKKARGIDKKLDQVVQQLRKDGVDAELRIGFESEDVRK